MRCADPSCAAETQAPFSVLLAQEWARVQLICRCLGQIRKGELPDDEMKKQLQGFQRSIAELRRCPAWQQFTDTHHLLDIDLDICMFAAAPQFDPQAGRLMHNLQPGINAPAPSGALIAELLFLNAQEIPLLRKQLDPGSALFTHGILHREKNDLYAPITPAPAFLTFSGKRRPGQNDPRHSRRSPHPAGGHTR